MFKCKACQAHEKHITDLNAQVEYLKSLIFNPNMNTVVPLVNHEANKLLEASHEAINITVDTATKDYIEQQRVLNAEANAYLSGDY